MLPSGHVPSHFLALFSSSPIWLIRNNLIFISPFAPRFKSWFWLAVCLWVLLWEMGLSSKQVSGDWAQNLKQESALEIQKPPPMKRQNQNQHQHQQQKEHQGEPLKCPRCESRNTKFCYYNNYNKTQPRHFCKSCKRHWTKGGTLRNVPVGGARKNKRNKKSSTAASNTHMEIQTQNLPPLPLADQKSFSDILYQALIRPPQQDSISNGIFLDSTQNQNVHFPFSSSFENNPSSVSTSCQYITGGSLTDQPWEVPTTSSVLDMNTGYWIWDDMDSLVSTDLNIPWNNSEIKP